MTLCDTTVRQAKPANKPYTLRDTKGLFLSVRDNGCKSWYFRYSFQNKQKRMSLGLYPAVSLQQARARCAEAHALLALGTDPAADRWHKRQEVRCEADHTFAAIYDFWYEHKSQSLKVGHNTSYELIPRFFNKNVLPYLGKRSIYSIDSSDLLKVVARIEGRGAYEIAKKIRGWLRQMFLFARAHYPKLKENPAIYLDALARPRPPVQHNPHLRMDELPMLLRQLGNTRLRYQTERGLRLLLLTGVRTCELREATPDQFDLERRLWKIPPENVKQLQLEMRRKRMAAGDMPAYIVPLSDQAFEIVQYQLSRMRPRQKYLFRHTLKIDQQMSNNTLNKALKTIGYDGALTGHGIRVLAPK